MNVNFLRDEKVFLAPLVGGSDVAFRKLCRRYGARVTFTEMCIASVFQNSSTKKESLFEFDASDRPLVLQLTDSTPEPIIELVKDSRFVGHIDAVDLNLGCPQSFAMKRPVGAGIVEMHGIEWVASFCKRIVDASPYPVTAKIRLFTDVPTSILYAQKLFEAGIVALTVHGRYWWQKGDKRGECDWAAIEQIKRALPPHAIVVGNGDVRTYEQLQMRLKTTCVDGVMVGYGALRDPTVFSAANGSVALTDVVRQYVELARQHDNRLIDVQRHISWLTKQLTTERERFGLFDAKTLDDIAAVLSRLSTPIDLQLPPRAQRTNDKLQEHHSVVTKKRKKNNANNDNDNNNDDDNDDETAGSSVAADNRSRKKALKHEQRRQETLARIDERERAATLNNGNNNNNNNNNNNKSSMTSNALTTELKNEPTTTTQ